MGVVMIGIVATTHGYRTGSRSHVHPNSPPGRLRRQIVVGDIGYRGDGGVLLFPAPPGPGPLEHHTLTTRPRHHHGSRGHPTCGTLTARRPIHRPPTAASARPLDAVADVAERPDNVRSPVQKAPAVRMPTRPRTAASSRRRPRCPRQPPPTVHADHRTWAATVEEAIAGCRTACASRAPAHDACQTEVPDASSPARKPGTWCSMSGDDPPRWPLHTPDCRSHAAVEPRQGTICVQRSIGTGSRISGRGSGAATRNASAEASSGWVCERTSASTRAR